MSVAALDIGGANLKLVTPEGVARTQPFALWRQPDQLGAALRRLLGAAQPEVWLVTMTGELCDCFATRAEGVRHILHTADAVAGGGAVRVWSTQGRFVSPDAARAQPMAVAAANWHAMASAVARRVERGRGLLIDIGSTTTDLIPFIDGRVAARGRTDTERLASGELVYLGATRTPLCALASQVKLKDETHGVMAELFATLADAFVLSGDQPERPACTDTADGRPLTRRHAAARVLRMIGADLDTHTERNAVQLAAQFIDAALARLRDAAQRHATPDVVMLSGSGEFLAQRLAAACFPDAKVQRLSDTIGHKASSAACAHALLELWCDGVGR